MGHTQKRKAEGGGAGGNAAAAAGADAAPVGADAAAAGAGAAPVAKRAPVAKKAPKLSERFMSALNDSVKKPKMLYSQALAQALERARAETAAALQGMERMRCTLRLLKADLASESVERHCEDTLEHVQSAADALALLGGFGDAWKDKYNKLLADVEEMQAKHAAEKTRLDDEWEEKVYALQQELMQEKLENSKLHGWNLAKADAEELGKRRLELQDSVKRVCRMEDRRECEAIVAEKMPSFKCPILQRLMWDPVVAADGHTYEDEAIRRWFAEIGPSARSPAAGVRMGSAHTVTNHTMRKAIEEAVDAEMAARDKLRAAGPV
jgi:hypothetical protein